MGRREIILSDEQKATIVTLCSVRTPLTAVAFAVSMSVRTLQEKYRHCIDEGWAKADKIAAARCYAKAFIEGDTKMQMMYAKRHLDYAEQPRHGEGGNDPEALFEQLKAQRAATYVDEPEEDEEE